MKFKYSQHAEERLAERGISKHEVEEVLRQGSAQPAQGGRLRKRVQVQGRSIEVIAVRGKDKPGTYKVITVYEAD